MVTDVDEANSGKSRIGCVPLALCATLAVGLAPAPVAGAAIPWAQERSDLKPDPGALFGSLANGMRYIIFRNATPAGQTSIRLRIGSGSLQETDAQQGLAHFLEHMAFRGSTHVPEGEMIKILQRHGLKFGADTNASTGYRQTVYKLDLPRSDSIILDDSLMLLREIASELLLAEKTMEPERGVVLSEFRLRDTPQRRERRALLDLMLEGQLAVDREPIGKVEILQSASAGLMREYYQANYRPERATLIVVGDIDPVDIEARIRGRFADWRAAGAEASEPSLGAVKSRGLTARIMELSGSAPRLTLAWMRPLDDIPDTVAGRRVRLVRRLALAILNERFGRLARGEHPPFLAAKAETGNLAWSASRTAIMASFSPDAANIGASNTETSNTEAWRLALASIDREQRRFVQYGVTQQELDRSVVGMRAHLQAQAAGAATRRTPDLASALIDSIEEDYVFTPPADGLGRFENAVSGLTLDEVNAAGREAFTGEGPIVFMTTPVPVEGGEAELAASYARGHGEQVNAPASETVAAWPYVSFGSSGEVVERRELTDLGAVAVRFANGVRLTVKPTRFRADQILLKVRFGKGRLDLPKDRPVGWMTGAFAEGGLAALSVDEMRRVLAGKIVGWSFGVEDDGFVVGGATRPQDLDVQLQVAAAYVAHPGWRAEAFERRRAVMISALPQQEATASSVWGRDAAGLLRSGDARWQAPGREQLDSARPEELRGLLEGPLASGPIEAVIVGDVSVDAAIRLAASTLGALPQRPSAAPPADEIVTVRFPAPTVAPAERFHKGRADDAVAMVAWPTTDYFADLSFSAALRLTGAVMADRLREQVRVADGSTYHVAGGSDQATQFSGYGFMWSRVETSPERIPGFFAAAAKITAGVRAGEMTVDDLVRARTPIIESIRKQQQTNEYWLGWLTEAQTSPRKMEALRTEIERLEAVTVEDVRDAAARCLTDERAWKMVVLPMASPSQP